MSDIKRAVLTTLEPQKVNEKPSKKYYKTVRIRVSLAESNEDKCPEYSYKDELAAVKKKLKQNGNKESINSCNGSDPFGDDNDDDVRRIALEMEAKYGSGMSVGTKKRRKGRKDDYADIGAGYNESDSFIDNTDGYDEIIPPNITTAQGGFYINSGALEFKTDDEATSEVSSSSSEDSSSSSENEEDEEVDKQGLNKSKRKRILDTSDDGDDEEGGSDNSNQEQKVKSVEKQSGDKPHISMQQAIKQKMFSPDKIQIKKRKLANEQKNKMKELMREKKDPNSSDGSKETLKENKQPMRLSSVDAAIDSVIGRIEDTQPNNVISERKSEEQKAENHEKIANHPTPVANSDVVERPIEYVKLPENLPKDILEIIEFIKKAARDHKDNGKLKFFGGEVNNMLLNLERKCKVLGRSSRLRVYEHLSPYVKCRKETLIKRARTLVFEEESRKLFKTISKLKTQIDQLLPALITNHEKECQRVLEKKFSKEAVNDEALKNLKAPRRRFPLHEEMKKMLRDIVLFKKRCLIHEGKPKDSLENLLSDYLKSNILPLWPDGWMSMNVLKKFCTSTAIKTPNPKANEPPANSQKPSSTIINYSSGNMLTITPVNLTEKLSEVSNNNVKPTELTVKPTVEPAQAKPNKEKPVSPPEVNHRRTTPPKSEPVIPKELLHCQVIDLTDTSAKLSSETVEPTRTTFGLTIEPTGNNQQQTFEATLKSKFPGLSVTATNVSHPAQDKDDVQKVMESLKALQKLSSPSKTDVSTSGVSVIAFNKNYSNHSNSNASGGNASNSERTNFSGAIGFQDEYQKQFVSTLNHRNPSPPTKPGHNRCS
ncbi:yemanuclein [Anthonomus grandis grandis]|uniref:yemanuclein n=1 Tax=Anthonomus grandis grandis TaxID=2921223 RepID=UPI00216508D3|nr:yemanuclein [Anthonomus grandis grandis]